MSRPGGNPPHPGVAVSARRPVRRDATLRGVTAGEDDAARRREEWERRQKRMRRLQDLGLLLLGIGVLVLAYIALTYRPT